MYQPHPGVRPSHPGVDLSWLPTQAGAQSPSPLRCTPPHHDGEAQHDPQHEPGSGLELDLPNFEWAQSTLLEAEARMPKVFAAMGNSDDAGVVEEVWQLLSRKGIMTGSEITRYLQQKVGPQRSWQTLLSLIQGAVIVKADDNSIANMMEGGEHTVWRYVAGVKPETF